MRTPQSPPSTLAIEARALTRTFGGVRAVDAVDLAVPVGAVTGILGPNGSGKSTFLRMLIGLVKPDSGGATLAGAELRGDGVEVRRRVTFAPGEIALYGELPADEQLDWLLRGRPRAARERSRAITARLGLPLDKRIHEFSHGMKRQLLFAAAMGPEVAVRILDEPTEGLDPAKRSCVLELIAEEASRGTAILLSSHHLSEVEEVCDRLVFFFAGRVLADEDPAELRRIAAKSGRLEYATPAAASAAAAAFSEAGGVVHASVDGCTLKLELADSGEPLAALAALAALSSDLTPPLNLELGRLSLTDLFARVYGVRGL